MKRELDYKGKWALITGTTSGIGEQFAQLLAEKGLNLVLISKNREKLTIQQNLLSEIYKVKVDYIVADLSNLNDIATVEERCRSNDHPIAVLVNNAGFGINADFSKSLLSKQIELLRVMVETPLRLSSAVIPNMKDESFGYIINVSSVAGYMSGSTYCSAKAWLNNFTQSVYSELSLLGIHIHAICPGFTKSNFHASCGQDVTGVPEIFWLRPEFVAKKAWENVINGKVLYTPGLPYKFLMLIHKYAPTAMLNIYGNLAKSFLRRGGRNT
jgi:hypothetical protein